MRPDPSPRLERRADDCRVSIVMPCLNEAASVGGCVDLARRSLSQLGVPGEVIVVDNGSTDGSADIAARHGARVVRQPRKGYGAALIAGIEASRGELIVIGDADGAHEWRQLRAFVRKIMDGYELVIGNRFKGRIMPGAMPFWNRYLGNPFFSRLIALCYGLPRYDFHCGMRAFTRAAYERLKPQAPGMEFAVEMIIKARRAGIKIAEVPVVVHPPPRLRRPHLRPLRDGWRHLRLIMSYAPNHLYLVPGVSLFAIGVSVQALLIRGPIEIMGFYVGIHFLALGCLATLVGVNVIGLGVFAKVVLAVQSPDTRDRMVRWLRKRFTLEIGLAVGLILMFAGMGTIATIVWDWFQAEGGMEQTIHLMFVAATGTAVGVQIVFGSFLLNLLFQK